MINLQGLLKEELFFCAIPGESKKRVLELIAELIHKKITNLSAPDLFDQLIARERLGSTGIGHGVAIPHCRLTSCKFPIGAFFHLEHAIQFDAIDNVPVDLLFVLIVPSDDRANQQHLLLLKNLAEIFSDPNCREQLRAQKSDQEVFKIFKNFAEQLVNN